MAIKKGKAKAAKAEEKNSSKKKKTSGSAEKLTGLAKYRAEQAALKATGKGGKAKKAKAGKAAKGKAKPGQVVFKAPEDFKPHFLELFFGVDKDGLIGGDAKAIRYQGQYNPDAEDKKKADLESYDPATLRGIIAKLAGRTFVVNATKRLPAKSVFRVLLRVGKKSANDALTCSVKTVWLRGENSKGRMVYKEMDKTDPVCRKIRSAARFLPGAFKAVKTPPKPVRGKRKVEDDE